MDPERSLQDQFAPKNTCFGCGPANPRGLQIKSFFLDGSVICRFRPESHHEAFPGCLNGGIIGSIMDCHCNLTAAFFIMTERKEEAPPCTVTAHYKIELLKPTPSGEELTLKAKPLELSKKKALIKGELYSVNSDLCATCEGLFVAVSPGHPAYHRW